MYMLSTQPKPFSFLVRLLSGAQLVLVSLSFTAWFSGTADRAGFADRVLHSISGSGFRLDVIYIFFATLFCFVALFVSIARSQMGLRYQVDAALCAATVVAFIAYMFHILHSGLLYFG